MTEPIDDILLSQLADGELESDRVNEVLLGVLDDPAGRGRLREMLLLRRVLEPWRRQQPPRTVPIDAADQTVVSSVCPAGRRRMEHPWWWQAASLATAAMIGGLLVMGGFSMARRGQQVVPAGDLRLAETSVPPEAFRQAASVFALHESVGGPLKWYASDDRSIQLASSDGRRPQGSPIAVLLRLVPAREGRAAGPSRDYTIVCRAGERASMEFPATASGEPSVRVNLVPDEADGGIVVRYSVSLGAPGASGELWSTLSGRRSIGLRLTRLGSVVLGDRQSEVQASARSLAGEDGAM
jgi:hypothetical protein